MNSFTLTPQVLVPIVTPGRDYRRQDPRGRGRCSQLSSFATVTKLSSSSPALVTKSLGYFWKNQTVSPPAMLSTLRLI